MLEVAGSEVGDQSEGVTGVNTTPTVLNSGCVY